MSAVDKRVVEMKFDNKQFEHGIQTSLHSLQTLKESLKLDAAAQSLNQLALAGKNFSLEGISSGVEMISNHFQTMGTIGETVIRNLTTSAMELMSRISKSIFNPIIEGGKNRALNIEQAKFQLEGLGVAWESIEGDISYGVKDTAYGLDAAAKVASQLVASNIQVGDSMKTALRGVSGVAAMTSSSYEEIGHIFTTVAGQGKLMSMQLQQLSTRGLNAAATLADYLHVSEAELREMVTKGQIDFNTFAAAMDNAYGEHAKDANKTFTGALSNMKAALSRIGAKVATPAFDSLKDVMNALIPVIDGVNLGLTPLIDIMTKMIKVSSKFTVDRLTRIDVKKLKVFGEIMSSSVKSLINLKNVIFKLITPLKQLFQEFFPPLAIQRISDFMKKTEKLTSNFKMTDDKVVKLKSMFKGLLGIFDIAKSSVSALSKILFPLSDNVFKLGKKVLDAAANFGEYIFNVDDTAKKNDIFYETLKKISEYIKNDFNNVFPKVQELYESFCNLLEPLTDQLSKAKDSFIEFSEKGLNEKNLDRIKKIEEIFRNLIESVLNVATAAVKIAKPITQAFIEMFPESPLKTISGISEALSAFTEKLKINDKTAYKIKGTFKGLFGAIDIVKQFFSALIRNLFPTTDYFGRFGEGILTVTSFLGEHIAELDKTIRENDTFYNVLQKAINFVKTGFTVAKEKVSDFAQTFTEKYEEITGNKFKMPTVEDFLNFIGGLKDKLAWVPDFIGKIKESINDFLKSFSEDETGNKSKVIEVIVDVLSKMSDVLGELSPNIGASLSEMGEAFDKIDFERMGKILNIAFFIVLIKSLSKLRGVLSTLFSYGRPFHNMNGILANTKSSLTALMNDIKANTLVKVAQAVSLLAASLIGLSMVKEERLTSAMGAMTSIFIELFGAMILMQKMIKTDSGAGLTKIALSTIAIAGAISILANSVKKLGKLDNSTLLKGLSSVLALLGTMVLVMKYMPQNSLNELFMVGAGIVVLSISLAILAKAFKSIGEIPFETLMNGLTGAVALFGMVIAALNYIPDPTAIASIIQIGTSMIFLSVAMGIMAASFKLIGEISTDGILKGLTVLVSIFTMASIMSAVIKPTMSASLLILSTGLVALSAAISLLAIAFRAIGTIPIDGLNSGLLTIISILGIAAIAATLIPVTSSVNLLAFGASLIVLSGALAALVPILKILGTMTLAEIGKSLLVVAAVIAVFGGAAALLSPIIPAIISFAGSMALLGLVFVGLGAGMAALAFGITTLSASAVSLTVFIYAIGQAIAALVESVVVIAMALLTGLETLVPKIISVAFKIVVGLAKALADNLPLIVKSGMMLILGILQGIDNNLDKIALTAGSIVVKLINALAVMLPNIIQAGINLMVNFIDGMAEGIRNNTDNLFSAIENLMSSIVEFALSALQQLVRNIPVVGEELENGLEDAKTKVREALAPESMKEIGQEAASATAEGIKSGNEDVKEAGFGLGNFAKDGLNSVLEDFSLSGEGFGTNFSNSLFNTNDDALMAGMGIGSSATNGLNSTLGDFGSLGTDFGNAFSLSLEDTGNLASDAALGLGETTSDGLNLNLTDIGEFSGTTYASGLFGTEDDVKKSTATLTDTATDNLNDANSKFKKSGSDNGTNYALGLSGERKRASNAGKNIAESGVSGSNSQMPEFRAVGVNSGRGFAAGLYDSESEVHNAGLYIAKTALNSMVSTLDIHSPSKEFSKIGMYSDKGLALGLINSMKVVTNASESVGEHAKKSLKNSLLKVSDIISDDFDIDPTIRVVVDLSDVKSSAAEINDLFGHRNLNLGNINANINDRNMQLLSDIVSEMQNGKNSDSHEIIRAITELREDVAYLGTAISKMQVKMDSRALVGSIVVPMDEALGQRMIKTNRGI